MDSFTIGRPMQILLVEDAVLDAKLTIAALARGNFRHCLTLMRDGMEAMEFLERKGRYREAPQPDLLLLDLLMPGMTGLQVLAAMRHDERLRSIPVVILTAAEGDETQHQAEHLKVKHYIRKPVNFDKFLEVVKALKTHWRKDLILPSMD